MPAEEGRRPASAHPEPSGQGLDGEAGSAGRGPRAKSPRDEASMTRAGGNERAGSPEPSGRGLGAES